jgi:tripartite-type tricarboxylate transporter receptor subunit TctC
MFTRRDILRSAAAAGLTPVAPAVLRAQEEKYPSRVIKAICMFPPGTGADILVRWFADRIARISGGSVIVENRPGAFGNIATEAVARSKPDGYTIYIAPTSSVLAVAPHIFKQLNYDPVESFDHITTISKVPFMFCVDGKGPLKTLADLTAFLKEKGDQANYGGSANTGIVGAEIYKKAMGLKTVHINYRTPQAGFTDVYGGQIAFYTTDYGTAAAPIQQGLLRPLVVTSAERTKANPDVPGARESGIAGLDLTAWWAVHTPKGTPPAIQQSLASWFNQLVLEPETAKFLATVGADPFPGAGLNVRDMLIKETKDWEGYVALTNMQKQ